MKRIFTTDEGEKFLKVLAAFFEHPSLMFDWRYFGTDALFIHAVVKDKLDPLAPSFDRGSTDELIRPGKALLQSYGYVANPLDPKSDKFISRVVYLHENGNELRLSEGPDTKSVELEIIFSSNGAAQEPLFKELFES